ncbi:uncharacterized protein LOC135833634 [Planococcus citri]|uniref:uncharacterized protein LOC135833634 n=1 Tax=Planococcus citri TaxID=170843 RepID=UPI0031FA1D72
MEDIIASLTIIKKIIAQQLKEAQDASKKQDDDKIKELEEESKKQIAEKVKELENEYRKLFELSTKQLETKFEKDFNDSMKKWAEDTNQEIGTNISEFKNNIVGELRNEAINLSKQNEAEMEKTIDVLLRGAEVTLANKMKTTSEAQKSSPGQQNVEPEHSVPFIPEIVITPPINSMVEEVQQPIASIKSAMADSAQQATAPVTKLKVKFSFHELNKELEAEKEKESNNKTPKTILENDKLIESPPKVMSIETEKPSVDQNSAKPMSPEAEKKK